MPDTVRPQPAADYEAPRVAELGTLTDLTLGSVAGAIPDALGGMVEGESEGSIPIS